MDYFIFAKKMAILILPQKYYKYPFNDQHKKKEGFKDEEAFMLQKEMKTSANNIIK